MKYIKIFESFWKDYKEKFDSLEKQGKMIKHSVNLILNKVLDESEYIKGKEGVNIQHHPDDGILINGLSKPVYDTIIIDNTTFCKTIGNRWWVVNLISEKYGKVNGFIDELPPYVLSDCLDILMGKFTSVINMNALKQINK